MAKTTKLIKQNDRTYEIKIPEEYVSKLGWENGHVLKIDADDDKIVIEKLTGFMGMWSKLRNFIDITEFDMRYNFN